MNTKRPEVEQLKKLAEDQHLMDWLEVLKLCAYIQGLESLIQRAKSMANSEYCSHDISSACSYCKPFTDALSQIPRKETK